MLIPGKESANDVLFLALGMGIELSQSGCDEDIQGLREKAIRDVDPGQQFEMGGYQSVSSRSSPRASSSML